MLWGVGGSAYFSGLLLLPWSIAVNYLMLSFYSFLGHSIMWSTLWSSGSGIILSFFFIYLYCVSVFLSRLDAAVVRTFWEKKEEHRNSIVTSRFGTTDEGMSTVI